MGLRTIITLEIQREIRVALAALALIALRIAMAEIAARVGRER